MANPKSDTTTTTIDREPQPMIQLPVININISDRSGSGSGNNDGDDGAVGKAMLEAATRYGFFYIDHDHDDDACGDSEGGGDYFSLEDVDWMFELSKKFFSSPREEKAQYKIAPDNVGWSAMHTELLDPEHQRVRMMCQNIIHIIAFSLNVCCYR
jgi:isopenicillin N synthase-like dioxygenase